MDRELLGNQLRILKVEVLWLSARLLLHERALGLLWVFIYWFFKDVCCSSVQTIRFLGSWRLSFTYFVNELALLSLNH
jgi:hypothetical protein